VSALRAAYRDQYGRDLDAAIAEETDGTDLAQAQAALTANPVDTAVATLINAGDGVGTNEEAIVETLRGIPDAATRRTVEAEFERKTGRPLSAMLSDELGEDSTDLEVVNHLRAGRTAEADAAALHAAMHEPTLGIDFGTDEDRLNQVLSNVPAAERQNVLDAYAERSGRSLDADLREELSGAEADLSVSLAAGDRAGAAAARMAVAAGGWGTDEDALYRELEELEGHATALPSCATPPAAHRRGAERTSHKRASFSRGSPRTRPTSSSRPSGRPWRSHGPRVHPGPPPEPPHGPWPARGKCV
jgi:hypothetical protein